MFMLLIFVRSGLVVAVVMNIFTTPAHSQKIDPVPSVGRVEVEWPDRQIGQQALRRLQSATETAFGKPLPITEQILTDSKIPVLVPEQWPTFQNLTFSTSADGDQYFLGGRLKDLKIAVVGSRIVSAPPVESPSAEAFVAPSRDPFSIVKTETGYTLGFARHGLPYTITVECRLPKTDKRCTDPKYIRSLANSMLFVGGNR